MAILDGVLALDLALDSTMDPEERVAQRHDAKEGSAPCEGRNQGAVLVPSRLEASRKDGIRILMAIVVALLIRLRCVSIRARENGFETYLSWLPHRQYR